VATYPAKTLSLDPRVVLDAKGPKEQPQAWIGQCVSYCITLNRHDINENPVGYFVITNGLQTILYAVDQGAPLATLGFADCVDGNPKYEHFKKLLKPSAVVAPAPAMNTMQQFRRVRLDDVNAIFASCHQTIYRKDNLSQAAGFEEFVKLIFLKLLSDKQIRDRYGPLVEQNEFYVPKELVKFSVTWIESLDQETPNPLDAVQFRQLLVNLENDIRKNNKKRIFKEGSRINLHPGTVKDVVRRLERVYLFGIDADLNGRLFETFLSATMRGKDLGQFFTPRSIAKLGTLLADPKVTKQGFDVVLDGCCGTGGFLIDLLADIWAKIDANPTLSKTEKSELRKDVADNAERFLLSGAAHGAGALGAHVWGRAGEQKTDWTKPRPRARYGDCIAQPLDRNRCGLVRRAHADAGSDGTGRRSDALAPD
jgi:type I restriction enzyme M protein